MCKNKSIFVLSVFIFLMLWSACAQVDDWKSGNYSQTKGKTNSTPKNKKDDWDYKTKNQSGNKIKKATQFSAKQRTLGNKLTSQAEAIGLSTGGAKDINNFRENIANGYMPLPTDITYAGLFYDYYFDTKSPENCSALFCPAYESYISSDPFSGKKEHYLSVGLQSGMKKSEFNRRPLDLVVVMDISGSMRSPFNKYYYDKGEKNKGGETDKSKMRIAQESLVAMTRQLEPEDRLGIVLYNNNAEKAKPLRLVKNTQMDAIRKHIRKDIRAGGGTNMFSGLKKASNMYDKELGKGREKRIIFFTDAMPNMGKTSSKGLYNFINTNAANNLFTTFVGIGVDFNSMLVDKISKVKGANYYSVHSEKEFKTRLGKEFDYMVTPLAFDVELRLDSDKYSIEQIYGSPIADKGNGRLLYVNTLFPSASSKKGNKGGIILAELKKEQDCTEEKAKLVVSYETRTKDCKKQTETIDLEKSDQVSPGVKKGVLLSRYANLLQSWLGHDRTQRLDKKKVERQVKPSHIHEHGLPIPGRDFKLGKWERTSTDLEVSKEYKKLFAVFKKHFSQKMKKLGDDSLKQEHKILKKLSDGS